jgi:hypothetical protein
VIDADGIAGAVWRLARERAEDGLGGRPKAFAKLAEAAQTGPDEREKVCFERILPAAASVKLLAGMLQCLGHKGGGNGFFGWKVVEQSPGGDPGGYGDTTGRGLLSAVGHEEVHGGMENALPGGGFGFGSNPHRICPAPKVSMLIK